MSNEAELRATIAKMIEPGKGVLAAECSRNHGKSNLSRLSTGSIRRVAFDLRRKRSLKNAIVQPPELRPSFFRPFPSS
jgi:hypothetical protein